MVKKTGCINRLIFWSSSDYFTLNRSDTDVPGCSRQAMFIKFVGTHKEYDKVNVEEVE